MKGTSSWATTVLATVVAISVFSMLLVHSDRAPDLPVEAKAVGDPVAVITPLPDYVSNGSWYDLDSTGSYDTDGGYIKDCYWEIQLGNTTETSHASLQTYMFKDLGLYKITLTVTDNLNQTDQAFTAVVSVLDTDGDFMSDWWEMQYFGSLNQTDKGDFDSDGYSNFVEFSKGTDPTVKDPQPSFVETIKSHWYVFAIVAVIIVCIGLAIWPFLRKRRLKLEKKKIEAAIEIEKELDRGQT